MAEDEDRENKTEEPSQKRVDDAIEQGDLPKSMEINTFFVLLGGASVVGIGFGRTIGTATGSLSSLLGNAHQFYATPNGLLALGKSVTSILVEFLALPLAIALAAALVGPLIQHRPIASLDLAMPKMSRVSLAGGFGRIYGKQSLIQFVKNFGKLFLVGAAIAATIWPDRARLGQIPDLDIATLFPILRDEALRVFGVALAIQAVIAGGDYFFQRLSWRARLRMSRQDLKDEHKQQEGSPEIKNRLRQLRREFARRTMVSRVPKATVIVANPTHFAVALSYEQGMQAPVCIAKGVDSLALRIRKLAEESGVPVVEDPPLARSLHRLVDVDEEIPLDLYKPVAEIIGYVMRLRQRRARPSSQRLRAS